MYCAKVVNNHGPAKPQRRLASSASPLNISRDTVFDDGAQNSPNNLHCMDTSFTNSATPKHSPACTLLKPGPLIADADADIENEGDLTPMNDMGFKDLLSTLNLSWDYITTLQDRLLEKGEHLRLHERRSSIGNNSSCSDEAGSTFKEIFGPMVKYEDWMAPLASPETLSEISSLGSRASFLVLPKDQSPLMRMKSRNGNSCSLLRQHHRNGKTNNSFSGNNSHHNRSFSCTYPEKSEVAVIGSTKFYSMKKKPKLLSNGNNHSSREGIEDEDGFWSGNGKCHFEKVIGELNEYWNSGAPDEESDMIRPKNSPSSALKNSESGKQDLHSHTQCKRKYSEPVPQQPLQQPPVKRVSFNLKRKHSKEINEACTNFPSSSNSSTGAAGHSSYDPTYPIFSHQEEYGVPCLNSPHYTYCGEANCCLF